MPSIKNFTMNYEALNPEGFFSEGDTITGTVTLTLTKATKVQSLFVKAKGVARVRWIESEARQFRTKRYFKVKGYLVSKAAKDTVLPGGVNHFKYHLTIPLVDMPSSFKGPHGKIVYTLEAKLCRSWRSPLRLKCEIMFSSKSLQHLDQVVMRGSVNKEMGIFSTREVNIHVIVDRSIYSPGGIVSVYVKIHNSSSKEMKPKFSLLQETVYSTKYSHKTCVTILVKMVGDRINAKSQVELSYQLKIPDDACYTVMNSKLVSVKYFLKVYLDIPFAIDPEVLFPLVIAPSSIAHVMPGEAEETNPAGASGGSSNSDFPPSALPAENYTYE